MSRAIKLKNNDYLDSTGIMHNRKMLSTILNEIEQKLSISITDMTSSSDAECYFIPLLKMCYFRGVFTGKTISSRTAVTVAKINSDYAPSNTVALSYYRGNSTSATVKINSDGTIQIYSADALTSSNSFLISGIWLLQ